MKSNEITQIVNKILDDPSDTIPNDLLRNLADELSESEVYVPVDGDGIAVYNWGPRAYIPVSCDLDDFEKAFTEESPEIFRFTQLEDFLTPAISGFMINPGGRNFSLNKFLAQMAFNKNRPRAQVTGGYDVKVRLNDFRPLTWRDMIIPDNITFTELDDILKTLWDFNGHHLSCFLLRKSDEIIIDDDLAEETMMGMDYKANATTVGEIFDNHDKITYWYDFGDD